MKTSEPLKLSEEESDFKTATKSNIYDWDSKFLELLNFENYIVIMIITLNI